MEVIVAVVAVIDIVFEGGVETYKMMTQLIVPRPIALVTSMFPNNEINVAPFSFFAGVSSNPPTVCLSVTSPTKRSGKKGKDTLMNTERTKEFVVNASQVKNAAAINTCSTDVEFGKSELELSKLSLIESNTIKTPRIAESDWSMECELYDKVQIGEYGDVGAATLIIGKVLCINVNEEIMEGEKIDMKKLDPLARLG